MVARRRGWSNARFSTRPCWLASMNTTMLAVHQRDGLAAVERAADQPVLQREEHALQHLVEAARLAGGEPAGERLAPGQVHQLERAEPRALELPEHERAALPALEVRTPAALGLALHHVAQRLGDACRAGDVLAVVQVVDHDVRGGREIEPAAARIPRR